MPSWLISTVYSSEFIVRSSSQLQLASVNGRRELRTMNYEPRTANYEWFFQKNHAAIPRPMTTTSPRSTGCGTRLAKLADT